MGICKNVQHNNYKTENFKTDKILIEKSKKVEENVRNYVLKDKNYNRTNKELEINGTFYEICEILGQGACGTVVKCINFMGEIVAIKIIKEEQEGVPVTALREIVNLKSLKHDNIVKLLGFELLNNQTLLCLEYIKYDLCKYCQIFSPKLEPIEHIMFQIFTACDHIHGNKIFHRDLKPQNILITGDDRVKIADFGHSRTYTVPINKYSKRISTLWYKSPELFLGAEHYSTGVDIWSIGCIMAELFMKKPLFKGNSCVRQLDNICKILGTPNENSLPGFTTFPNFNTELPDHPKSHLKNILTKANIPKNGVDLICKMLIYDPTRRISCKNALEHEFFYSYRKRNNLF